MVLDVPLVGGGGIAAVERRAGQSVGKRGVPAEVVVEHGGDQLHQLDIGRVCAGVCVHGVYQPD